ncbi:hypothetical protein DPMN_017978, partial [Dreissena polymorpha]
TPFVDDESSKENPSEYAIPAKNAVEKIWALPDGTDYIAGKVHNVNITYNDIRLLDIGELLTDQFAENHILGLPCIFEKKDVLNKRKEIAATLLLYEVNVKECCPACGWKPEGEEKLSPSFCGVDGAGWGTGKKTPVQVDDWYAACAEEMERSGCMENTNDVHNNSHLADRFDGK